MKQKTKRDLLCILFILPSLAGMCIFYIVPFLSTLFRDIEAINTYKYADSNLSYNLGSVYEDYFINNTITAEECCKELAGRVYLYMNE